jgi:hypothetical protein
MGELKIFSPLKTFSDRLRISPILMETHIFELRIFLRIIMTLGPAFNHGFQQIAEHSKSYGPLKLLSYLKFTIHLSTPFQAFCPA